MINKAIKLKILYLVTAKVWTSLQNTFLRKKNYIPYESLILSC